MPEFNAVVDASHITGIGTTDQGALQRMLILVDIEQIMSSAGMGLVRKPCSKPAQFALSKDRR